MKEVWKDIPGYEGLYQASNLGRIKSFWCWSRGNRYYHEKILKPCITNSGYELVILSKARNQQKCYVARLVLCAFTNKPYNYKMTVNHKDCNKHNNYVDNLEWMTIKDNILHAVDHGLFNNFKVEIVNKETGEIAIISSLKRGSKFMGRGHNYLSSKILKGIFDDANYKWKLLEEN